MSSNKCDICYDDDIKIMDKLCKCLTNYCQSCFIKMNNKCCVCKQKLSGDQTMISTKYDNLINGDEQPSGHCNFSRLNLYEFNSFDDKLNNEFNTIRSLDLMKYQIMFLQNVAGMSHLRFGK